MSPIHYHPYHLHPVVPPNAITGAVPLSGVLLRQDEGFACLQPWPQFGDPSLDQLLAELRFAASAEVPKPLSPLLQRAFACLAADGAARRGGFSLFEGQELPLCHYFWNNAEPAKPQLAAMKQGGYRFAKIKIGRDRAQEMKLVRDLAETTRRETEPWLRLDANGNLHEDWVPFFQALPPKALQAIELMEDPLPATVAGWEEFFALTKIPLAADEPAIVSAIKKDFQFSTRQKRWKNLLAFTICKPARSNPADLLLFGRPLIFTHNMDHALGHAFAAHEMIATQDSRPQWVHFHAGLQPVPTIKPNAFSERITTAESRWQSPGGTGLGFDDLLERLPWKRLS